MSEYIGGADVAAAVGVSRPTLDKFVKQGLLPAPVARRGTKLLWSREAVNAALERVRGGVVPL
jgi:excisionase family DNA binding protein